MTERGARRWVVPLAAALPALAMLLPVLRPGYVLRYDMVFTPRQPLLPESVGLGPALPRAVPADAVVAVLTSVLPGDLVQKAALLLLVWAAALGAARLLPTLPAQLVAGAAYGWNAYVAERLLIGHWSLLLAYAALPWIVAAGLRLRDRAGPRTLAVLALALAPAALVPTGGVLAAAAALAAAGRRRFLPTALLAATLNAPWWVPAVWHGSGATSDPAAVAAFASRAEGPGGVLATVLGLGGIWNAATVPPGRHGLLVPLTAALVVAGTLYGLRPLAATWGRRPVAALGAVALLGLVLAVAAAVPGLSGVLRGLVDAVPGAGLLRDAQKWVAWWALLAAPACAMATTRLATAAARTFAERAAPPTSPSASPFSGAIPVAAGPPRARWVRAGVALVAILLPAVLLPGLAWGAGGRLEPVRYPADWSAVRDILAADDRPGDVVVLPWQPFRRFAWNDGRVQLDPAPRYLPHGAVVADALTVGGVTVRGEDPRAARAEAAIADGRYGAAGIGWVLVERGTPGALPPLAGLELVHTGEWLTLYRVPGDIAAAPRGGPPVWPVVLADVVALLVLLGALAIVARDLLHRRLPVGRLSAVYGSRRGG